MKKLVLVMAIALSVSLKGQCDSIAQPLSYSTLCHTFCVAGTYNPGQSGCNWQRVTGQYGDSTTYAWSVNGSAPSLTPSVVFTPSAVGVYSYVLTGYVISNGVKCLQDVSFSFTVVMCGVATGLTSLTLNPSPKERDLEATYYDLYGNVIEKRYNEVMIERVGNVRRKVYLNGL